MRTPRIFELLLDQYGCDARALAAIRQSVAGSTAMAMDITPGNPIVHRYLQYEPAGTNTRLRQWWRVVVQQTVTDAVNGYQPILKAHSMMA